MNSTLGACINRIVPQREYHKDLLHTAHHLPQAVFQHIPLAGEGSAASGQGIPCFLTPRLLSKLSVGFAIGTLGDQTYIVPDCHGIYYKNLLPQGCNGDLYRLAVIQNDLHSLCHRGSR